VSTRLGILRHGRASGQGPDAALLPEGAEYVRRLGRRLRRDGFSPVAAFSSPYRRARETATVVLGELASALDPVLLAALTPDADPQALLDEFEARGLPAGDVLVVSHLPLVARLASAIAGATLDFTPGAWAEFELERGALHGEYLRYLGPDELAGG
jgi:phosphohistidine phosphatase SixA